MKKLAKNLCGRDLAKTITYTSYEHGPWDSERRAYKNGRVFEASGPILMITHKKDGTVNVRIGKSDNAPYGAERSYSPNTEVKLA